MTKFFQPDTRFVKWLVDYANGRLIIDLGCGDNHLKPMITALGGCLLGVDILNENADIVQDATRAKWLEYDAETVLFLLARPCHGHWLDLLFDKIKAEILYIGLEKNLDDDLGDIPRKRLNHKGGSVDGECVWTINQFEPEQIGKQYITGYIKDRPYILYFGYVDGEKFIHHNGPSWMVYHDGFVELKAHEGMPYDEALIDHHVSFKIEPDEPVTDWRYHQPEGGTPVYFVNGFISPDGKWHKVSHQHHRVLAERLWYQTYASHPGEFVFDELANKGWLILFNGSIKYHPEQPPSKQQKATLRSLASNCPDPSSRRAILNAVRGKYEAR